MTMPYGSKNAFKTSRYAVDLARLLSLAILLLARHETQSNELAMSFPLIKAFAMPCP